MNRGIFKFPNMKYYCDEACTFHANASSKWFATDLLPEMKNLDQMYKLTLQENAPLFLLVSRTVREMMKYSGDLKTKLEVEKQKINWPKEDHVLSLHVRRGDSCGAYQSLPAGRKCDDLSSYIPHIDTMIRKYAFKYIFLASDDPKILGELSNYYKDANVEVLTRSSKLTKKLDDIWKRHDNWTIEKVLEKNLINGREVFEDSMLDILLLSEGDAFVGKFTSNVARLAFELMYTKENKECIRPFVSLDASWCFNFGQRIGYNQRSNKNFYC